MQSVQRLHSTNMTSG